MRKKHHYRGLCAFMAVWILLAAVFPSYGEAGDTPPKLLKSVTYVSDAWVMNFWNSESDHMEAELARIAQDGFNSIILAVPWREFQPETDPVKYSDYAFEKLDRIMRAAKNQGLWVSLRVGYTWDHCGGEVPQIRYRKLLGDERTRAGWLDYAKKLYESVSGYENFYGGFLAWEDFWNYMEDAPGLFAAERTGIDEARRIGFQKYLEEHYTLDQVNEYFSPERPMEGFGQVGIPKRNSPAYKLFYEYYDDFLMRLLWDTQQVFPGLSMEVRLDVDPVEGVGGGQVGAAHYQTFPCGDASYTALMYSVSMGQGFDRVITAAEAVSTMEKQLRTVKEHNGGKPIFIDQLLYMDETPGFEHNARLAADQRNDYLVGIGGILNTYTNGYAVWSYRNYANNAVFNGQFALGAQGWETRGVSIVQRGGSSQAWLRDGGSIAQDVGHRLSAKQKFENHVRFTADSDRPVKLSVTLGGETQEVTVDGKGQYDLNYGATEYLQVRFRANGDVYLDNVSVYNFVQDGQLYDMDGAELGCLEGVRRLNGMLGE